MKRILSVLLIAVCLFSLTACQASGQEKNSARFVGKVLEKYKTGCLVEVIDKGNNAFSVGDLISVNTNIENCPDYAMNDLLTITFDGTVAESYPMQIFKVSKIEVTHATETTPKQ